jgi:mono/diheme cytochrome c family protein
MKSNWRSDCNPILCAAIAGAGLLMAALPAEAFFHDEPAVDLGRTLYAANCASCHGTNLEGQPDWQSANEDGTYPAPPHDESGHTWHHGDAMLHDYVKRGGQAVLDDMGVNFTSGMPGFSDKLTDEEIEAVLDFIKSTWPERIRGIQEERAQLESTDP